MSTCLARLEGNQKIYNMKNLARRWPNVETLSQMWKPHLACYYTWVVFVSCFSSVMWTLVVFLRNLWNHILVTIWNAYSWMSRGKSEKYEVHEGQNIQLKSWHVVLARQHRDFFVRNPVLLWKRKWFFSNRKIKTGSRYLGGNMKRQ